MTLVVLFGASGAGKTTIAEAIAADEPDVQVAYFDRIGVPSPDEMVRDHGSEDEWQRMATAEWLRRLAPAVAAGAPVLLEGRTRPSYLDEAAVAAGGIAVTPVLIDCDDDTRLARLADLGRPMAPARGTPGADDLRGEAAERALRVIDTSMRGVASCADEVIRLLRR